jgi:hypothetical protein
MGLGSRVAAMALVCATIEAGGPAGWVPARWQGGPLEVRRRAGVAPSEITRDWYNPRTLDFLENTPINCLLVTWSAGAEAALEAEQRKLVTGYARAARGRGIAVLGLLHPGADPGPAAAAAMEAGLDGLVLDGDFPDGPKVARELRKSCPLVVPLGTRDWLSPEADWPVWGTQDAVAPGIRAVSESDAVDATPTSEPWIDSNTWLIRSLGAAGGGRPVWLGNLLDNPSAGDYARAIADAAAGGGRWVVTPDDALRAGLWRGQPEALATWRRVGAWLNFYERHAEWRAFAPAAALGIIQHRAGQDSAMADENLNLIARRRIPYRVIERRELTAAAIAGLPVVLAAGLAPLTGRERGLLAAFAGPGRMVVYEQDPPDPETLSKDLLDLIGNQNLPVRLFNAASVLPQAGTDPGGRRLLVQLVNYATEPSERITVRAAGEYRAARLYSPDAPPADLKTTRSGGKTDVLLAKVAVYAALLLEK